MSDIKLGTPPAESAQRDAIHIAIAPVVAGEDMMPGDHVAVENGEAFRARNPIGIVDPFCSRDRRIAKGARIWVCLYQNTIVGMRHHWSHPSFPDEVPTPNDPKSISIAWLTKTAEFCGVSYESMMGHIADGDYIHMGENERYKDVNCEEFAKHVEIVTGKSNEYPPFSCSC